MHARNRDVFVEDDFVLVDVEEGFNDIDCEHISIEDDVVSVDGDDEVVLGGIRYEQCTCGRDIVTLGAPPVEPVFQAFDLNPPLLATGLPAHPAANSFSEPQKSVLDDDESPLATSTSRGCAHSSEESAPSVSDVGFCGVRVNGSNRQVELIATDFNCAPTACNLLSVLLCFLLRWRCVVVCVHLGYSW